MHINGITNDSSDPPSVWNGLNSGFGNSNCNRNRIGNGNGNGVRQMLDDIGDGNGQEKPSRNKCHQTTQTDDIPWKDWRNSILNLESHHHEMDVNEVSV